MTDVLNEIDDTLRSDPVALKRKEVNDAEDVIGLVTTSSPSGLMLTIP